MFARTRSRLLFTIFSLLFTLTAQAQPLLPDMIGATQNGVNVVTWTSQYDVVKSIAVQRSADSVYNYATIGFVKDLKRGPQAFIDGHPMPGKNWYRLYIVFNSDLTWYSNRMVMFVDSAQILAAKALPPNDSLQKFASKVVATGTVSSTGNSRSGVPVGASSNSAIPTVKDSFKVVYNVKMRRYDTIRFTVPVPQQQIQQQQQQIKIVSGNVPVIKIPELTTDADASNYIKSQYIFTNPFNGHINVEIPDAKKNVFSIKFFDSHNRMIMEVPRISEPSVVIDKRNFQRKGVYRFDLLKDRVKIESGFVTIY